MDNKLSKILMAAELSTAFTSFVLNILLLKSSNELLFSIGSENNSPLFWITYSLNILLTFFLFAQGINHFQKLRYNKKLTSQDKKIGLIALAIVLLIMAYLYLIPYIGIFNALTP
jgi:fatty acid desaturase